jgi:hypothetical protein
LSRTITISMRLPNRDTHPNSRRHYQVKGNAVRADRDYAERMARRAMGKAGPFAWPAAVVKATWTFKTARKQDRDNLLAWCKAYFDGFADAHVVSNDSGLTHLPHEVTKGPNVGVVFEITRGTL